MKTIEPLQQLLKNKGIFLSFENKKSYFFVYDEDRLVQVITNLLSNAIKFCPENDGIITVSIEQKEDFFKICIKDNGKGIQKNDFENIFDKFYQSDNQNIKKPIGSGLGLAICKQIIELHRGKIWAENNENSGACFTFTLPNLGYEN